MGTIIAGIYEIERQIGAGGGGTVYLGKHLRLGKQVVLKADKRTLSARPEVLRREVDALKNLSHTYIPQVYDFVAENETVYTVMDYIQGESLDKPLSRGERFEQAQVIKWACQLLEALQYLHSQPPHGILHGDLKPANVMLTPQGDIRLIDFNIALALGEEGAVQVGFSRGYASPEHYGIDYRTPAQPAVESAETQVDDVAQTVLTGESAQNTGGSRVRLDVRSDIYSLGATLYHLLSGVKPAQDARDIVELDRSQASQAVAEVIRKAMSPNPDLRYQTAEEMLDAFLHLRENDPRVRRFKRIRNLAAATLSVVCLAGAGMSFLGLQQMERAQATATQEALQGQETERVSKQALAAIREAENAYQEGATLRATELSMQAMEDPGPYGTQAQKALTDALGVYELSDRFRPSQYIELPGQPLKVTLSSQGGKTATLVDGQVQVFDAVSGEQIADLPAEVSALSDLLFLDEETLLYAGLGGLRAYDLTQGKELWRAQAATAIALSADHSTVAAVYKNESEAMVYDASTGALIKTIPFRGRFQPVPSNDRFADPGDSLFALSGNGGWLAVSFEGGGLRLIPARGDGAEVELYDSSTFTHFEGGFFGHYFAFSAAGEDNSVFAVVDLNTMEQTGGFQDRTPFHTQVDETGIYLSSNNLLVGLDPVSGEQKEVAYTGSDISAFRVDGPLAIAATSDGGLVFFDQAQPLAGQAEGGSWEFLGLSNGVAVAADRDRQRLQLFTLETHPENQIAVYDSSFDHDEARLSPDGKGVLLFRYDAFQIQSVQGEPVAQVTLPEPEQVYDQQYVREGGKGYLDVTYYDGRVSRYDAATGELLGQEQIPPPDKGLEEEFLTDRYKVVSPLHGAPIAYTLEEDKAVADLTSEGYLTYVTQVGDYLITEYITADGERYGLLRDSTWAVLARLPQLCDILEDGTLVFDDKQGILRQSRIYSAQELITLGNSKLQGGKNDEQMEEVAVGIAGDSDAALPGVGDGAGGGAGGDAS